MTACGMLDFPAVFHPFREPFMDCWQSLTEKVRNTPVLKGCADCDRRDVCSPCVATIHAETGTTDQKASYMCKMSECIIKLMNQELEELQYE